MDMVEQRIREIFATLLSKGAKVLERTAGELAHAASELRQDNGRDEAERAWAEETRDEAQTMVRGAPLRAVPDTPTDEADGEVGAVITPSGAPWTPPSAPPAMPEAERHGDVDAVVTASSTSATSPTGTTEGRTTTDDRIVELSTETVSQIRAQLGDLSPDELRRLKETELASRKRTTLIAAIDRALADTP